MLQGSCGTEASLMVKGEDRIRSSPVGGEKRFFLFCVKRTGARMRERSFGPHYQRIKREETIGYAEKVE